MDKKYWNRFYREDEVTIESSDFSKFCANYYTKECGCIIDLGCGNGRDTFFFLRQNIDSIGIDQSEIVIKENNKKSSKIELDSPFVIGDFSNIDFDSICDGPHSVYSRFTLHAINYDEEEKLFKHLLSSKNLKYLFIEVRSIKDSKYGQGRKVGLHEFSTSHYRRFIDSEVLHAKLKENFEIIYFKESQGFAKTKKEDPWLIRIIAKRL
tara:strand:- start:397 stop:1023 length:627 start_codon:yes stop_codon:yes gene_type:complete